MKKTSWLLNSILFCMCVCLRCLLLSYVRLISHSIKQMQSVFITTAITSSSFVNFTCLKYELRVMFTESSWKHGIGLASVSSNQADIKMQLVAINIGFVFPRNAAEGRASCWQEERNGGRNTGPPMRKRQCIWFSKRCRYQHFWIAWPDPAFPLFYLSSRELAPGKKWWKATQYLNASRPNKSALYSDLVWILKTALRKQRIPVRDRLHGWLPTPAL